MASIRPKPSPVLVPDLGSSEKTFCRLCLVNNTGHLELLHHNISAPHVKRLRARIRLRSQCTICRVHISDIKAAEAHVQDSRHERRLNYDFNSKAVAAADQTYKCPPCRLVFNCSIALELHLFMTHKVRFSTENLPELTEIFWLLSGSSPDASKVTVSPECDLCDIKCEAGEDFLLHLFSNVHMKSLRTSTCVVCELNFIHVNDREGHLHACKHKFHLQKICLTKRLKKLKDMGQVENRGYMCMYCMIWCKSWPCFMLHLLGSAHIACAENQDQQQTAVHDLEKVETTEDSSLSSVSGRDWKRWADQSTGLSAWCLVCEETVSTPEALEKHLEGHQGLQSMHTKSRNWINSLAREGKACDYFECEVCCVIFKNDFSLTVHKALRQHHIQQAQVSNGGILCRCYDCRMRVRNTAPAKTILPKSNPMTADGGKVHDNVTAIKNNCTKESNSEDNRESSSKMISQVHDSTNYKDKPAGLLCPGAKEISEPGKKAETEDNHQSNEQKNIELPTGCQCMNELVCHEQTQSGSFHGYTEMVPVVIAAALPPSESVHNSIQSALKLVKESLSVAVPKIRKCSTEFFSANKRLKGNNCDASLDEHDCRGLQRILEAAVCEGLQSLTSHSNVPEAASFGEKSDYNTKQITSSTCCMPNGSCGSPMSISTDNVGGISIAFAAAIIPQYSSTEAALQTHSSSGNHPPLPVSDHENELEMTKEKTCIGHQEFSGTREIFQETDCVHDEKLSTQDSTQRLTVVYEQDTSSDSDDRRVYLSPDESESSEG